MDDVYGFSAIMNICIAVTIWPCQYVMGISVRWCRKKITHWKSSYKLRTDWIDYIFPYSSSYPSSVSILFERVVAWFLFWKLGGGGGGRGRCLCIVHPEVFLEEFPAFFPSSAFCTVIRNLFPKRIPLLFIFLCTLFLLERAKNCLRGTKASASGL